MDIIRSRYPIVVALIGLLGLNATGTEASGCAESVGHWGHGPTSILATESSFAYVANGGHVAIVDHSDPDTPSVLGTVRLSGAILDLALDGDLLFAAVGAKGLQVIDVSDRSRPVVIGKIDTCSAFRVVVDKTASHVIDRLTGGMVTIDVSNRSHSSAAPGRREASAWSAARCSAGLARNPNSPMARLSLVVWCPAENSIMRSAINSW